MPATSLRCRSCATEYALEDIGTCTACFGPLDPVYDWDELARTVSCETIAAGPASIWRYAPLLPVEAPAEARLAPGFTPLVRAPRLADEAGVGELWLKLDTANPTHSFKDRVVAVAAAKARELGLETIACSSTGNLANAVAARAAAEGIDAAVFCPADLEPEKLVATAVYGATIYAVCRDLRRLQPAHHRALLRAALGLRQRESALVLRRRLEDRRLRDRRAARLGRARRGRGARSPRALSTPRSRRASTSCAWSASSRRRLRAFSGARRRAARRWRPPSPRASRSHRSAPATVARSLAIGNPADGDKAVATARRTGGAVYAVPEEDVGENMSVLAQHAGVFGETAAGVSSARSGGQSRRASSARTTASSSSSRATA